MHVASVMCEHVDEPFDKEYSAKEATTFDAFYQNVGNEAEHVHGTIETLAKHSRLMDDLGMRSTEPRDRNPAGMGRRERERERVTRS